MPEIENSWGRAVRASGVNKAAQHTARPLPPAAPRRASALLRFLPVVAARCGCCLVGGEEALARRGVSYFSCRTCSAAGKQGRRPHRRFPPTRVSAANQAPLPQPAKWERRHHHAHDGGGVACERVAEAARRQVVVVGFFIILLRLREHGIEQRELPGRISPPGGASAGPAAAACAADADRRDHGAACGGGGCSCLPLRRYRRCCRLAAVHQQDRGEKQVSYALLLVVVGLLLRRRTAMAARRLSQTTRSSHFLNYKGRFLRRRWPS